MKTNLPSNLQRKLFMIYGLACYGMFLLVVAYMTFFVAGALVPKTIDGPVAGDLPAAMAINLALILGFGLQHSIMARPTFKHWWTRFVPQPIERSTYVLFSNITLILLMWLWQPIDSVIWHVEGEAARVALWVIFATGWLAVPLVSLLINHFDLFGLRQVWLHLRGKPYTHLPFRTPMAYKHVRHPLYVGWMIAFWTTPTMTFGHLLFASAMTTYILIAIYFEERNLVQHFGAAYAEYRKQVPMLIPLPGRTALGHDSTSHGDAQPEGA